MARIVTEDIVLRISKLVKDDAEDSSTILTDDENEVVVAVIEEMDSALTGVVVEIVDVSQEE